MGKRTKKFEKFVTDQTESNGFPQYEYSDSATIKNRFRNLLCGSKSRLRNTFKKFVETKKGTCWELAISYDHYLFSHNVKNHHIVAVKTGSFTCHTFNIYVDCNRKLHVIDLYKGLNDTLVDSYGDFCSILGKMFDQDYKKWYVLSEVKNNFLENFKRLGMKKWAGFCSETEKGGGFMIINKSKETFEINSDKKIKWKFTPFKFPTFG